MSLQLGKHTVRPSEVKQYLHHDLFELVYNHTVEQYELPRHTKEQGAQAHQQLARVWKHDFVKDLFANEQVAKRFIKQLQDFFVDEGANSLIATYKNASDEAFYYVSKGRLSKADQQHNAKMVRIFNPLLDQWSNDMALQLEDIICKNTASDLARLEKLAAQHNRKGVKL